MPTNQFDYLIYHDALFIAFLEGWDMESFKLEGLS